MPVLWRLREVTVWIDLIKMLVIASLLSAGLCIVAVLLAGTSERLFMLLTPSPKWPLFLIFLVLWCFSMKGAYWWVFQRHTFYGSK
ncbi:MAG: hypothetical protein ACRD3B_04385 [Candidatus Sulfotelmatobacter sp.]